MSEVTELEEVAHQMVPWVSADEDFLENSIRNVLPKYYSMNTYHDF
jgi:hypothetical protein